MTMPPEEIEVCCPACGTTFKTWHRASMNLGLDKFSPAYVRKMSSSKCPQCKTRFDLGGLIVGKDGVWRFSSTGTTTSKRRRPRKPARSKQEISNDLSIVLKSDLTESGKRAFIDSTLWCWSEYDGKYTTRLRSSAVARNIRQKAAQTLRHDHAVPRTLLEDYLIRMHDASPAAVHDFLTKYCVGVTITKEENDRLRDKGYQSAMPNGWNWDDPRARYTAAEIEIEEIPAPQPEAGPYGSPAAGSPSGQP